MRAKYINEEHDPSRFTYLKPKTSEEIKSAFDDRIEELCRMDSRKMIDSIYTDVRDKQNDKIVPWGTIASELLDNIDRIQCKKAIKLLYQKYFGNL